jgi:hypothetical protein
MIFTALVLSSLVAAQDAGLDAARPHRSFRFVYSAAVPEVPAGAKQVRLWVPIPLDTPDQTIAKLSALLRSPGLDGEGGITLGAGAADGSRGGLSWKLRDIRGGAGRSLCVETEGQPIDLELAFDVTRHESKGGGLASRDELERLRGANRKIPLNGKVAAVAAVLETSDDPLETARVLYDHTLERMKYDKPEDRKGWGLGDAEWACDARFGNCTDFHSYFMGLARSKGLAARFEMGFPIPNGEEQEAKVGGYHCWAYVWIEGRGWLPVDISEADKHPELSDYFFGTLDANRVTMTGGRDLVLDPAPAEGPLNFFVYPHAEIDGKKAEGVTKSFKRVNL